MGKIDVGMVTRKSTMEFEPCIKCGSEEVQFRDCGYSTFNPFIASCKCGHEVREMDTSLRSIVTNWNRLNDPSLLLKAIESKMEKLKTEARNMKKIIASRNRQAKKGGVQG